ncbi:MAG: hypothetical protein ACD_79C01144G0002 [uncultured bacterium]|nr:MAG: hypothetical protein ACD_79C01144G0002 [uncultured bacterium]
MNIRILESASKDLIQGYWFYEKQRTGLGNFFLDSLFSDIDSLTIYAGIHSIHFNGFYRLLSKRFPYAIYYKINKDIVLIYSVLDCRKNPNWIKNKLNKF